MNTFAPSSRVYALYALIVVGIALVAILNAVARETAPTNTPLNATSSVASAAASNQNVATSSTHTKTPAGTSSQEVSNTKSQNIPLFKPKNSAQSNTAAHATSTEPSRVSRVQPPYAFDPLSLETLDSRAREATVNILCMPKGGSFRPTSGSGIIIDPRGIILTNAHVAQYVLLSQDPRIDLSCTIRTGSPATPHWIAKVMYIPPTWVDTHYADIRLDRPTGTGEHDYALLEISTDMSGIAPEGSFPYVPIDTRENIAFQDDTVLVAGYPAEFTGGIVAQRGLYAVTTTATIGKLYTFNEGTVDLFSVGGIITAQGGSSGGPVINLWGHVVGLITTTSDGSTTAARDLHANTVPYINRDIKLQSGMSLLDMLAQDQAERAHVFNDTVAPSMLKKYFEVISQ